MTDPTSAPEVAGRVPRLMPCPFCGGTEIDHRPTHLRPRMDGKPSALISYELRHWCQTPGLVGGGVNFRGRDEASAVAAWNRRAALATTDPTP
jgi:hypothetical protein